MGEPINNVFGDKIFELQELENELISKFKEMNISFEQAEMFLDKTKQSLKRQKLG